MLVNTCPYGAPKRINDTEEADRTRFPLGALVTSAFVTPSHHGMNSLPHDDKSVLLFGGNRGCKRRGPDPGWERGAVSEHRPALTPAGGRGGPRACRPLLVRPGPSPQTACSTLAVMLPRGVWEHARPTSQACPRAGTHSHARALQHAPGGPSSLPHPPPGVVCGPAQPGLRRCEWPSKRIHFEHPWDALFLLGFRILFQTKIHTQETVWQDFPPCKAAGESRLS